MDNTFSTTVSPTQETFTTTVNSEPVLSPSQAEDRATRYSYGLGPQAPSMEEIKNDLVANYDKYFREKQMLLEERIQEEEAQKKLVSYVQAKGKDLSEEDLKFITSLPAKESAYLLSNPDMYMEKKTASRVVSNALKGTLGTENIEDNAHYKVVRNIAATNQGLQSLYEDTKAKYDKESWASTIYNYGKEIIPLYGWWLQKDKFNALPTTTFLKGSNLKEQVDNFYEIAKNEPDRANVLLRSAVNELYDRNPVTAMNFLKAFQEYSKADAAIDNIFMGLDVALLPGTGLATRGARNLVGGVINATSGPRVNIPGILNATGNTAEAAFRRAQADVMNAAVRQTGSASAQDAMINILNRAIGIGDLGRINVGVTGNPDIDKNAASIMSRLFNQGSALLDALGIQKVNVTRIEPGTPAYRALMDSTLELANEQYSDISNAILRVDVMRSAEDALTNTDKLVIDIGRKGGTLFSSDFEAKAVASLWGMDRKTIEVVEHSPNKWMIRLTKHMQETEPSVREALRTQLANTVPDPAQRTFFSFLHGRDEIFRANEATELKNAALGSASVQKLARDILEANLKPLRRGILQRLDETFSGFLSHQQNYVDPQTGRVGRFSESLAEFNRDFTRYANRAPSEQEALAYFSYRQMNDVDYAARAFRIHSQKARLGIENWTFHLDGVKFKTSPFVEGRITTLDNMLRYDGHAGILLWDTGGNHTYLRKGFLGPNQLQQLLDAVVDGYKVVQLDNYGADNLRRFYPTSLPDGAINYVVVKKTTSSPMRLDQHIPYRPGGHRVIEEPFFVSIPRLVRGNHNGSEVVDYMGDINLFGARTRQEAQQFAQAMTNAVNIYHNPGNLYVNNLSNYLATHLPMFTENEFIALIHQHNLRAGDQVYWRARNTTVNQQHKLGERFPNFYDNRFNAHNTLQEDLNLRFALERDITLNSVDNVGSTMTPVWNLRPSRYMDPSTMMFRANKEVLGGMYLDDAKIKMAEGFVAEFGQFLKGDLKEHTLNPVRALFEGQIETANISKDMLAAAKNRQRSLKEFFHQMEDDAALDRIWMRDRIFNWLGERGINPQEANTLADRIGPVAEWLRPDNIQRSLRSLSYSLSMGFWNPRQLFVQAMGVVNTAAIDGSLDRVMRSHGAYGFMRALMSNPDDTLIRNLSQRASTLGWNPAHFEESFRALRRSGWANLYRISYVEESGLAKNLLDRAPISNDFFFKAGEGYSRYVAWNTSYLRWREANPLAKLTDANIKEIMNRADLYTTNMTKASDANFQAGWLSIPTQFWSYQARLMDQMWGNKLTFQEKRRLVIANSLLYGIPMGVGGTMFGAIPVKDIVNRNFGTTDKESNPLVVAAEHGVPQAMVRWLGGEDANFSSKFGPSGISFLYDIFHQIDGKADKTIFEILGGPSGNLLAKVSNGALKAGSAGFDLVKEQFDSLVYGAVFNGDTKTIRLTSDVLLDILSEVSSSVKPSGVKNAIEGIYAISTGEYILKNGSVVSDGYSPVQGALTALMGLKPQMVENYSTGVNNMKDLEEAKKFGKNKAIEYIRKSLDVDKYSDEERAMFMRKASAHMEFSKLTPEEKVSVFKEVGRQQTTTQTDRLFMKSLRKDDDARTNFLKKLRGE